MAIRLEAARGDFSAVGGLQIFDTLLKDVNLREKIIDLLPHQQGSGRRKDYRKFKSMIYGFLAGAECLEDMDVLGRDPGFESFCGNHVFASTTYGSFLRSFEQWHPRKFNEALRDFALKLRRSAFKDDPNLIIDVDTTAHEQYGKKMEGVTFNYAHKWCLDSLQAYDQYGFQYWMDVRPGNTYTCNGVANAIRSIFSGAPRRMHRYMRGDSGMCTIDIFNACLENNVEFVVAAREPMYETVLHRVSNWHRAKHTVFRDNRPCEIGSTVYFPKGAKKGFRIIFVRALKEQRTLFGEWYDYRAWITNIGQHQMQAEKVIDFYKKRGNAENFIRELKNGFDMHHFPCQKLLANKMYGLMAAFAHNLMRFMASIVNPKTLHFSKMLRFRLVYLAGQVVKKARYTVIRLSQRQHKEVENWLTTIKQQLGTG